MMITYSEARCARARNRSMLRCHGDGVGFSDDVGYRIMRAGLR